MVISKQIIFKCQQNTFHDFKTGEKKLTYKASLRMNEQTIEQVNSTIFLGVIIDEQLSWKYHVAMRRSKMTGVMAKVRQLLLPCKILLILHNTMIYPIQFNLLLTIVFGRVLTALDFSLFSAFRRKLLQLLPFQILGTTQAHCLNH